MVNPINKKARSIPVLNVVDPYGRVFFFSWMGFMLGFWAWYTFPPLLTVTIKKDLHLSAAEVANSNIVSLCATLLLRFVAGPLCDQFGSRRVYASLLLLGCLPVGLAPLVKTANGLYVSRFFIGILGATFVPCQVWCTGFFDKNIVGTANALSGGWGNAGGGITYFIMPAVFDSLVASQGMAPWEERSQKLQENLDQYSPTSTTAVNTPHILSEPPSRDVEKAEEFDEDSKFYKQPSAISLSEAVAIAQAETVVKPSFKDSLPVMLSLQTLFHVATYSCSFGGELAVNSILSSYYKANFPHLDQTKASNYAAIFGFLNFVTRPLGGVVADILYRMSGQNLWTKKAWITMAGLLSGALLIIVGKVDPSEANGRDIGTMVGLVTVAAFFIEAGNGANFALVPHVYPAANGVLSGCTGGGGNLGGVVFAIIFRFIDHGSGYATACWVIGVIHIAVNLAVCRIPPLPKGQVGGQ
ncbi:hypothetical protein J3459_004035 [Metarhizium acridum]|nr:hypothetical protein J3459_004035 [Metarhizium acridum]